MGRLKGIIHAKLPKNLWNNCKWNRYKSQIIGWSDHPNITLLHLEEKCWISLF